jgi:hypothetical protein
MGKSRRRKKQKQKPNNSLLKKLRCYIRNSWLPILLSIAGFIVSTIGGNLLSNISPIGGLVLFIVSLCIIVLFWLNKIIRAITKNKKNRVTIEISGSILAVVIILLLSPYILDYFFKNHGSIEMPTFVDDSTTITVLYGNRPNPVIRTQLTLGELKQNPSEAFKMTIGNNTQTIFNVHVKDNKLFIDTQLFAGTTEPPVLVKDNGFSRKPDGWKVFQNNNTLEIDNEENIPILLMEYKSPYKIIISGLFVTPDGICKVNNNEADAIFQLGDYLYQLGTYKVDRVFIHSIFDLFQLKKERIYTLSD